MIWELACDMDIDKYSALVAMGGDGTYHDVMNGMLFRKDKKRFTLAFIPNGSGNDGIHAFGITVITKALDYIVAEELLKINLVKVLIDHETEQDIPEELLQAKLRYQLQASCDGQPARANKAAAQWKWWFCNPYHIAAIFEIISLKYDIVDVYLNDKLVEEDVETSILFNFSGKHGGRGMMMNPLGVINDGQVELHVVKGRSTATEMGDSVEKPLKHGGIQYYNPKLKIFRG